MKKIISLLLIVLMGISLCACGKRIYLTNGNIIVPKKELATYITKVELTTENWTDYIEVVEKTEEHKNAFGDVVSTTTQNEWVIKNAQMSYFDGFAMELTVNETGEKVIMKGAAGRLTPESNIDWFYFQNFTMDDLTCSRVIGVLYILNAPEDIQSIDEYGNEVIYVLHQNGGFPLIDSDLKVIYESYRK